MEPQDQTYDHEYEREAELASDYGEYISGLKTSDNYHSIHDKIVELIDEKNYWRQRCELAEKINDAPLLGGYFKDAQYEYNKFIIENKQP